MSLSSLPWTLAVHLKPGEHCERISDLELELQVMNVHFVLTVIIWGDGNTHFVGFSVDLNRENHIFYDGMASTQMVIFQHNKSYSSIATFGGSDSIVVCQEGRTDSF